jgi:hypothetical protein
MEKHFRFRFESIAKAGAKSEQLAGSLLQV